MSTKTSRSRPLPHLVLRFVLGCPLLPCLAHAQAPQKTPTELEVAVAWPMSVTQLGALAVFQFWVRCSHGHTLSIRLETRAFP